MVNFTIIENLVGRIPSMGEMSAKFFADADPEVDIARDIVDATAQGASSGRAGFWLIIGLICLLGLAMLLMVLGQRRRASLEAEEETENPLFEEQYAIHEPEYEQGDEIIEAYETEEYQENFAEVVIEEQEMDTLPELEPETPYEDAEASFAFEEEAEIEISKAASPFDVPDAPTPYEPQEPVEEEMTEIAAADDLPDTEEPSRGFTFMRPEEETRFTGTVETNDTDAPAEPAKSSNLKYAAAATAAAATKLSFKNISAEENNQPEQPAEQSVDEEVENNLFDEQQSLKTSPYIAPIVQADLDRADRRHEDRIHGLRTSITDQLKDLRNDNNTRLERVVSVLENKLITSLERKLDDIESRLGKQNEARFAAITPEITAQIDGNMAQLTKHVGTQSDRLRAITKVLDDRLGSIHTVYEEVRNSNRRIDDVGTQISRLEKSIVSKANHGDLADVQLTDVVRAALPPDQYEFKALLPNNHRADCLIRLPHPPGRIVIDTHFPLDAFNTLISRGEAERADNSVRASEDAFRRTILRHIIALSERFIIPGHTSDSAILFLPTEAIYTALHARFPDVVHDSFRARIWIVSPSTLMGTLQTLRGVLRDSGRSQAELEIRDHKEDSMRAEIERLRGQARSLAENFEETQSDLRSLLEATDTAYSKARPMSETKPSQAAPAATGEVRWPTSSTSSYWDTLTSNDDTPSDLYPSGRKPSDTLR